MYFRPYNFFNSVDAAAPEKVEAENDVRNKEEGESEEGEEEESEKKKKKRVGFRDRRVSFFQSCSVQVPWTCFRSYTSMFESLLTDWNTMISFWCFRLSSTRTESERIPHLTRFSVISRLCKWSMRTETMKSWWPQMTLWGPSPLVWNNQKVRPFNRGFSFKRMQILEEAVQSLKYQKLQDLFEISRQNHPWFCYPSYYT